MRSDKIIFLDVDGVLNGVGNFGILVWRAFKLIGLEKLYKKYRPDPFRAYDRKVKLLSELVNKTGAKVILTSSCRFRYLKYTYDRRNRDEEAIKDTDDRIIQLYNVLKKYKIHISGYTDSGPNRGAEVLEWLSSHDYPERYVILDDENTLYSDDIALSKQFIQTSSVALGVCIKGLASEKAGLKRKHVKKAIKILNNNEENNNG